jgi:ferredoxin, 2Fe-2S
VDIYRIQVTDRDGVTHALEGPDGWRVMEVIRDNGLPIKAECGGACACATCHVYVDEAWVDRLVPASDEEIQMMDEAFDVQDNSRLSCQILLSPELDGLQVTLAPQGD